MSHKDNMRKNVCFLIRQLNDGGAQRQLIELARGLNKDAFNVTVVACYDGGRFAEDVRVLPGVAYISLGKRGRWDVPGFMVRLARTLRGLKPDVLHGYLTLANILSVLMKPLLSGTRVVLGVRASNMDPDRYDWLVRSTMRLERMLSRFADLVIVNSRAGRDYHLKMGYPEERLAVIPNGVDADKFRPDPAARRRVRSEWGVGDKERLIGLVARLDPMKGHATFIQAAALLTKTRDDVRFVCVGDGPARYRNELHALSVRLGLGGRLVWAGSRGDMPAVYNALDIAALSSSYGEGFPNAVGEAMACGVPCVVTDEGDSRWVVGETGVVVPHDDPQAFADGLNVMLGRLCGQDASIAGRARARIVSEFGCATLVRNTSALLEGLS